MSFNSSPSKQPQPSSSPNTRHKRLAAVPNQMQQISPERSSASSYHKAAPDSSATGTRQMKHIMFISGQEELAEMVQIELSKVGYQVSVLHDGLRGLLAAKRMNPDVVIACWQPPRLSGLEICERLRAGRHKKAIVLLTPENDSSQRVTGLERGADDCISLPLQKEEFVARVKARLQSADNESVTNPLLYCADLLLNRETREVFRGGQFIRLTAKEFDLLEYLMDHYFQVVTRAQILENVWGYAYEGSSNIVEVYIRYLRTKLEAVVDQRVIHTVRSVGYILRES